MRPRRYDGDDNRRAILDAAIEIFGLYGYEGASTRKIAAAAGIEQGHLIYYYKTKELLWRDVVITFASGTEARLAEALERSNGLSAADTAWAVLPEFLEFCADNPHLVRLMLQEFSINSPRHDWLVDTFGKPIWLLLKPVFDRLHVEGLLFGAAPEVAYFTFVGAALVTFGNLGVTRRIAGIEMTNHPARDQHINYIMKPIVHRVERETGRSSK